MSFLCVILKHGLLNILGFVFQCYSVMRMGDVWSGSWNLKSSLRVLKELERYDYTAAYQDSCYYKFRLL